MGFKLILAGLVFFFNPCINIVDILPDFIGCILISAGLYKLADIEDRFATARKTVNYLIPIYIAKFLLSFLLTAKWKDGLLPFTFVYAVGEIILMIVFCVSLYGAIEYMANLHDGEKHLAASGSVCKISIIFAVLKNVLAFIPEAFVLSKQDADINLSFNAKPTQALMQAKPYVVLFFSFIVLVAGIYFLVENAKFFGAVAKDKVFVKNLSDIYSERILENEKLMNRRSFFKFTVLMIVGSLLLLDLIVDAVNVIPDVIAYSVMFSALITLGKRISPADKTKVTSVFIPLCIVSLISTAARTWFDMGVNYTMGYESYMVSRNTLVENGSAVFTGAVLSAVEGVISVLFVLAIIKAANSFYKENVGSLLPSRYSAISMALVGISSLFSFITPLIKAEYFCKFINDTFKYAHYEQLSERWELIQGYSNIALIISVVLLVHSFIRIRRKVDIEL